jgi:glycosyltransferase involved in cell wall biosynthesis
MRICCVIASLGTGGAERVMSNLANYWVTSGHEMTLITLSSETPFYPLEKAINVQQLGQTTEGACGIIGRLWAIARRLLALRKAIKQARPDVVLSFVDIMNVTTLLACMGLPAPVIVSERTDPAFHEIPWLYKHLRTWLYRRAKAVVIQTKSAAAYFENFSNITIIPNVVVKPINAFVRIGPIHNIISVGRLCPFKGFETLIEAFSVLYKTHPHLRLTIHGEGPDRKRLESLIKKYVLDSVVSLPGKSRDLNTIFQNADLFVFPSFYEGFPNALCEAMAAGLPVIASNCSGNVEVVKDKINGLLYPMKDAIGLKLLMEHVLRDEKLYSTLSENAITLSEQYSAESVYPLWDSLIKNSNLNNTRGKK